MPNQHKLTFGQALKDARKRHGLLQKEVVARLDGLYSDAGTYGRVEQGTRIPDRSGALAIVMRGLEIRDAGEISRLLELAGYTGLSPLEVADLGLRSEPTIETPSTFEASPQTAPSRFANRWPLILVVLGLILPPVASTHPAFVLSTSVLYAALFAVSIYLESAFETKADARPTVILIFAVINVMSVAALVIDEWLVRSNNSLALPIAAAILFISVAGQFFISRTVLPATVLVPARFSTMTAQTAHLKNSCYFLLLAALFWLPPFHAVVVFAREQAAGHKDWVAQAGTHDLLFGRSVLVPSIRVLLILLLGIVAASIYMGARLLDRLRPDDRLNHYTQLFYLRAVLYFTLCIICVAWYAYSLSSLI